MQGTQTQIVSMQPNLRMWQPCRSYVWQCKAATDAQLLHTQPYLPFSEYQQQAPLSDQVSPSWGTSSHPAMASGPFLLAVGTSGLSRASGSPSSLAVMLSSCTRSAAQPTSDSCQASDHQCCLHSQST